jgi:hypothetical protein
MCTHVDDFYIAATSEKLYEEALTMLKHEFQVTENSGVRFSYLGLELDFSEKNRVKVLQSGYERGLIEEYPTKISRKVSSPATDALYDDEDGELLPQEEQVWLRRGVARMAYLANRTRGEILTAVMKLATRSGKFTKHDMGKFNRLVAYLHQHRGVPLVLGCKPGDVVSVNGYIDASHAVHKDMKSQSGCVISLGVGSIYVSSKKQKTVSKSSTEAELIALSDNVGMILGISDFLDDLGIKVSENVIFQDNTSAITMANSGVVKVDSLRHIKIRVAQLKGLLDDKSNKLRLEYLPTEDMLADILTKAIHGERLAKLASGILGSHFSND